MRGDGGIERNTLLSTVAMGTNGRKKTPSSERREASSFTLRNGVNNSKTGKRKYNESTEESILIARSS